MFSDHVFDAKVRPTAEKWTSPRAAFRDQPAMGISMVRRAGYGVMR